MPDKSNKFYLTTPIYYVNARPHIGHAYTTIVADTIARRYRLLGDDTFFLTGTDEHGQKIERSAAAAGIDPQTFTDQVSAEFRGLWDRMGLTNDDFIRTTEPRHKQGAQRLFALLHQRGQIYLSSYTGQYSIGEEIFVDGPPGTIGPDGKPTETVTEENFFFRLSEYQLPLLDLIESDKLLIQPESRKNEVLSFIRGNVSEAEKRAVILGEAKDPESSNTPTAAGTFQPPIPKAEPSIAYSALGNPYVPGNLRDLSVSRSSFTWGIPVPEPAASETQQKHVIYVWLDALANYMTAVGYGSDTPEDIAKFNRYWPADLHTMAKEITRQHCVYWPAFLLAAGLPLPKAVAAHGWLLFDDAKMSKSKGNIVRTETILDAFGTEVYAKQFPESTKREQDLFATDVLRYHLLREVPFGQDGSFSFDAMITRYNADLANGYGNLVSRTLSMIHQNCAGIVPDGSSFELAAVELEGAFARSLGLLPPKEIDSLVGMDFVTASNAWKHEQPGKLPVIDTYQVSLGRHDFSTANEHIWKFIAQADGFITSQAPWKLAKDATQRSLLEAVLYTAAESIRYIRPAVFAKGPDYSPSTLDKQEQLALSRRITRKEKPPTAINRNADYKVDDDARDEYKNKRARAPRVEDKAHN